MRAQKHTLSDNLAGLKHYLSSPAAINVVMLAALATVLARQAFVVDAAGRLNRELVQSPLDVLPFVFLLAVPTLVGLVLAPVLLVRAGSRWLSLIIAAGFGMRLFWFGSLPPLDDDFYRYLWDGAVLAAGQNPYAFAPEQVMQGGSGVPEALAGLAQTGGETLKRINFPELKSIYPGVAQLIFALAHWLSPWQLDGLRSMILLADSVTLLVLAGLLRALGRPLYWLALYWCNPLVILSGVGAGHIDAFLPPLVLGSFLALYRKQTHLAGVLLGLAVGIKIWPALLAPLLFRPTLAKWRRSISAWLGCAAVSLAVLLPLILSACSADSGLSAYASSWHINNAPFDWLRSAMMWLTGEEKTTAGKIVRLLLGLAGGTVALYMAWRPVAGLVDQLTRALVIAATVFYLSPAEFPWYALWFLPLAALMQYWPLLLASATLPVYYLFLPLAKAGHYELFQSRVAFIHTAPVWLWIAWRYLKSRRRNSGRPVSV